MRVTRVDCVSLHTSGPSQRKSAVGWGANSTWMKWILGKLSNLGTTEDNFDDAYGPPYSKMMPNFLKGKEVEIFLANATERILWKLICKARLKCLYTMNSVNYKY